jgi:hypothetical protein
MYKILYYMNGKNTTKNSNRIHHTNFKCEWRIHDAFVIALTQHTLITNHRVYTHKNTKKE